MKQSEISGKQFKMWRSSKGWQRGWLAGKLGVSPAFLWKYEKDDVKVPLIVLLASMAISADLPIIQPTKGE